MRTAACSCMCDERQFSHHRDWGVQTVAVVIVYVVFIDHFCVSCGQLHSAVFGGEEALGGGGSGNTPEVNGSKLELGRCSLS